jgi:hypothetical protein
MTLYVFTGVYLRIVSGRNLAAGRWSITPVQVDPGIISNARPRLRLKMMIVIKQNSNKGRMATHTDDITIKTGRNPKFGVLIVILTVLEHVSGRLLDSGGVSYMLDCSRLRPGGYQSMERRSISSNITE